MEDKQRGIEKERLYPYIRKSWISMNIFIRRERKRLGPKYNNKNIYEEVERRFGNARREPEKFADEYILILHKKSEQPSSIREAIMQIVGLAVDMFLRDERTRQAGPEEASGHD